ncbi:hypothetical protein FQR65_LT06508 [Abscondita terminalis]|nr:hypothetical protein FQR65_LT06508 [Abscondita terminalis]
MSDCGGPILYVIVVGFHHKKGCQVEYSFPALVPDAPNECPPGWKYLPTLALPDGSHNYDEDTVYFHLPSLTDSKKTVYGISCYRQIPVEKIKNKTADITRGTVQKSVCVLSKLPLFGHIQVKMALITHAYFDEGDFSKVSLLEDTYHHLNSVLLQNEQAPQTFVGLSARDFILQWRHKALLLFKLLLLEKRVIFYRSPVQPLCSAILTLLSLHPLMIEKGLEQSACVKLSRPMSPMPDFSDDDSPVSTPIAQNNHIVLDNSNHTKDSNEDNDLDVTNANLLSENHTEIGVEVTEAVIPKTNEPDKMCRDVSTEAIGENVQNNINLLSQINLEQCGVPLSIFTKGCLCLPYLSLPYLDLLSDMKVRGYVVGATNILFKQKRQLSDVLVDIENFKIECQDVELRKQLHLTTEDLRFADYIVKHVSEEKHDVFLDGVGWEGGDEWIRAQFKIYLLYLLKTSCLSDGSRELEHFNVFYMAALKETHNYKMWKSNAHVGLDGISCGHPFAGQLSVSDMKLRLAHTMQNTEGGRKLNQAMASTGRVVATTSKAVGGALSQAKGAFSNWWSNLLVSPDVQKGMEATNENINNDENSTNIIDDVDQSIDSLNMHLANGSIIHEENKNCSNDSNLHSIVSNVNEGFVENEDIVTGKVHIV